MILVRAVPGVFLSLVLIFLKRFSFFAFIVDKYKKKYYISQRTYNEHADKKTKTIFRQCERHSEKAWLLSHCA
jgi:hypothetical protein